jgi:Spy/CpxP family protein refolding chaperone
MDAMLSDEQQDKVFAIMHAAAPALRDQAKAARKARESLHDLVESAQFSEAAAASLAEAEGKAEGQQRLLRTRMEHDLYALLTPDQRTHISSRPPEWGGHRGGGPIRP